MKPRHYYHEMFKMNYFFCIGWAPQDFEKYMFDSWDDLTDASRKGGMTVLTFEGETESIVIWTKEIDLINLAHECVHAACMTLERLNIDSRFGDGEILAYLVEDIMRKALAK